jgi:nucleotide-binding universal stress UspA family protein
MNPAFLNIVCPVDFSEHASTAAAYAAALADHFKAQLHVLTVTSVVAGDASALEHLERFLAPITARLGRLYPEPAFIVRHGIPGDVILSLADEDRAELVVISTHGAGAGTEPYGSTTLQVMRHAEVPLLIVPPALHGIPPPEAEHLLSRHNVVLAPIDFHQRAHRDARIAAGLAEAFGLDLLLLHVLVARAGHTPEDAQAMLNALTAEVGGRVRVEALLSAGDAAQQISRIATERNAGVIVMGLRGDGGGPGSLPGSIAYEVLRRAPALVLALPAGPTWVSGRRIPRDARISSQPGTEAVPI